MNAPMPPSQFTAALLGTLVALGTPLSWKKTHLAEINTWLGFVIHPSIPRVQMAAPKRIKVMELLEELANGSPMSAKAIEKAMGRIQWATVCCPLTKSLLQPLWAWKTAVKTMGHPPKVVRTLAALLGSSSRTPLNSTHLSCRSRLGGDAVMLVHPKQVKPMLGVGARPPQTPPRTRSYGSTMLLQLTPTLGASRMATLRNASLPWNSWAHCFSASTW